MIIRTLKEVAALIIFTVITWCTGSFLGRLFYDAWKLRDKNGEKRDERNNHV